MVDKSDLEREISSGIIVFRKSPEGPRFLILFRATWTFPRGKIEKEERSFEAALRETQEETGLTRGQLRFVDYFKAYENWTFTRNGKKVRKTVIFYLAQTTKRQIRISEEHWGYVWLTYKEAMKMFSGPRHGEDRKVLLRVQDFLSGKKKGDKKIPDKNISGARHTHTSHSAVKK